MKLSPADRVTLENLQLRDELLQAYAADFTGLDESERARLVQDCHDLDACYDAAFSAILPYWERITEALADVKYRMAHPGLGHGLEEDRRLAFTGDEEAQIRLLMVFPWVAVEEWFVPLLQANTRVWREADRRRAGRKPRITRSTKQRLMFVLMNPVRAPGVTFG